MVDCCDQAGCNQAKTERHVKRYVNGHWDSHPSPEFALWFQNDRYCRDSEVKVHTAWNTQYFRDLFAEAKAHGWDSDNLESPVQLLTPEAIKAIRDRRLAKLAELRRTLAKIGRPMPKPTPGDYDKGAIGPPSYQTR